MQPVEFIERLSRHYSKRHASPAGEEAWVKEMISVITGTDTKVLDRAYEIIRDEHEERAFPLPATLKKAIAKAGEQLFPDAERGTEAQNRYNWSSPLRYVDPARERSYEEAAIWQRAQIRQYGSWDNQWRAVRHQFAGSKRAPVPIVELVKIPASMKQRGAKLRRLRMKRKAYDRPFMHELQTKSANRRLHIDGNALMRRITGERE